MDYIILLISLCATASGYQTPYEPYGVQGLLLPGRGGSRPVYPPSMATSEFMDEYEPYAYAAIPLASMPLFHIVSPPTPKKYKTRTPARKPEREYVYAASSNEQNYDQYSQESETTKPKYSNLYEEDTAPVYVYARPNKNGGYTYRKPSVSTVQPYQQREPFVVRIHKYRISRER